MRPLFSFKVPATSANLGCGFDSVGLAVNLFLEVEVLGQSPQWQVIHDFGPVIATDASNLLVKSALDVVPDLEPHTLKVVSQIPLEHGLGSSSSAVVAGIELADRLGGLNLSLEEKLRHACKIEGHADNVAPAILGGLVVGVWDGEDFQYVQSDFPEVGLIAVIPDVTVNTHETRKILPKSMTFKEAVHISAISNVMIASLLTGDIKKAVSLMEQDKFHEPYRQRFIPEFEKVRETVKEHGGYGVHISGSGSTIMCLAPRALRPKIMKALEQVIDAKVVELEVYYH